VCNPNPSHHDCLPYRRQACGRVGVSLWHTRNSTPQPRAKSSSRGSPSHILVFSTKKSNASVFAGLNKEQLFNIKPYDVDDGLPDNYVPSGNPKDAVAFFVKAMPANYRTALDEAVAKTGRHITCLVSDAFFLVFVLTWLKKCMQSGFLYGLPGLTPLLAHISSVHIRKKLGPVYIYIYIYIYI